MPKVSVIVPVYNVEAYLEKCVRSVLAQTLPDFELLLVDDGATDGSGALCDRLAQEDPRIRVIHQENQGLGGARNTGMAAASGDWLLLVDSDDWIEPGILEKALAAGERQQADLVVFGFQTVDEQGTVLRSFTEDLPKGQPLSPRERKDLLLITPSAWNKLYRRELFTRTGLTYPSRVWYEDLRTTQKLLTAARSVVFLDDVGYNYLQRAGSIMNSKNVARNGEILDALDDLLSWFRERGLFETYRSELEYLTLYHVYLTSSARVLRLDRKSPLLREFAAYTREKFPDYRKNPYLPTRLSRNEKLLLALLERGHYRLVETIFRLKK